MNSDKTVTSLKFNALVAHPVHVLWLNVAGKIRYSINHRCNLFGILPAGVAELAVKSEDLKVEENVSLSGLPFSDAVPSEHFIPKILGEAREKYASRYWGKQCHLLCSL